MTDDQLAAQPPPLQPLHRDGVAEFGLGTVVFAVASALLYFGRDSLGVPAWWVPMALTGLVIGLTLTLVHILGIFFTGTSVNPARSFGPALIMALNGSADALNVVWVFIVGPLAGGLLAAGCWKVLDTQQI